MPARRTNLLVPLVALSALLALTGCGNDDGAGVRDGDGGTGSGSHTGSGSGSGSGSGTALSAACPSPAGAAGTALAVTLDEWSVAPAPTTVAGGRISFQARNTGEDVHRLVVVRGDDPLTLPRDSSTDPAVRGSVVEDALPTGSFVGQIDPVPAGATCTSSFAVTPGRYVLYCDIVEQHEGKLENHFDLGMRATLTVT